MDKQFINVPLIETFMELDTATGAFECPLCGQPKVLPVTGSPDIYRCENCRREGDAFTWRDEALGLAPGASEYEALKSRALEVDPADLAAALTCRRDTEAEAEKIKAARTESARTGAAMVDEFLATVQGRKYEPMPTGIADLDNAIGGGLIRQQLVFLGAAPGAGKTALAQWLFENMAEKGLASCLYINLEMSREQMLARSLARLTAKNGHKGITPAAILQGYKWSDTMRDTIKAAADAYKERIAPRIIYCPETVSSKLETILAYIGAEAEKAEAAQLPAPVVVIDYLQLITGDPREDASTVIKRAVMSFKQYAIQHNTVVFIIMAHNRTANSSGSVSMDSGRDTSAIEYSADLQLALTFTACLKRAGIPAKAPDELTKLERKNVTLVITKARFGLAGAEIDLYFDGATMSYTTMIGSDHTAGTPFDSKASRRL